MKIWLSVYTPCLTKLHSEIWHWVFLSNAHINGVEKTTVWEAKNHANQLRHDKSPNVESNFFKWCRITAQKCSKQLLTTGSYCEARQCRRCLETATQRNRQELWDRPSLVGKTAAASVSDFLHAPAPCKTVLHTYSDTGNTVTRVTDMHGKTEQFPDFYRHIFDVEVKETKLITSITSVKKKFTSQEKSNLRLFPVIFSKSLTFS